MFTVVFIKKVPWCATPVALVLAHLIRRTIGESRSRRRVSGGRKPKCAEPLYDEIKPPVGVETAGGVF